MLTIRKRGKKFHIRGTIRVGRETRIVQEHSTGCDRREDAEAYKSKLEADIRHEALHGRGGRTQRLTIADAGLRYIGRPGGLKSYDLWRVNEINNRVGEKPLAQAADAWAEFKRTRCGGLQPATVERFRAIFQAMLNYLATEEGFDAPKVRRPRSERLPKKRVRFLSQDQATRLVNCYAKHVQPVAVTLRYQGLRIGEALRIDWVDVSWSRSSLFVAETKNGESRTLTMHAKVRRALHRLWVSRGSPNEGRVFLNRLGEPYADTREYELPGGSPIRKSHATACGRAGITDFHVHDWRHHWACWCVMSGIDLETIRQEGGWKSLRMVECYATVSAAHRARAMRKLK
jgi:integrase